MPWDARDTMSLRTEFIGLAQTGITFAALCRRFQISRKTGYKWLQRFRSQGPAGLADASRRPCSSPARTNAQLEQRLVALRLEHPAWGARKLRAVLVRQGAAVLPATSTITDILRRHGLIRPEESTQREHYQRFERATPNELWQMDFKGHFQTDSERCHPLTILDDHSRYALALEACANERAETVRQQLTRVFRRYGLPQAILADNGAPWGAAGYDVHTSLSVWLLQLNIRMLHGRPHHPQTQGKEERFHRTLKAEVLNERFGNLVRCQQRFEQWRSVYNWERPHEALALEVPGKHYRPSARAYPERLPELEFAPDLQLRKVDDGGRVRWQGRDIRIGRPFEGLTVGVRTTEGGCEMYFGPHLLLKVGAEE